MATKQAAETEQRLSICNVFANTPWQRRCFPHTIHRATKTSSMNGGIKELLTNRLEKGGVLVADELNKI